MFNKNEISFKHKENCVPPEYYFDLTGQSSMAVWNTFREFGIPPSTAYLATIDYCPDDKFVGLVRFTRGGWYYEVFKDEYQSLADELIPILDELIQEVEEPNEQERQEEHGEEAEEEQCAGDIVSESTDAS